MAVNPHFQSILDEYRRDLPLFREAEVRVKGFIQDFLAGNGPVVAAFESRVKTEGSLIGKLELKGSKYNSLADITDILGVRVITFYLDDVDKVASALERLFEVDWENTVDKRKLHEIDRFGYRSLHYVCRLKDVPYRFEVQIRTILQHAWANMNHDTGYKSGIEVPLKYLRNLNRLAGMLELVDEQFSTIRTELTDYRRRVQSLVASGNLDEVPLDGDTFRSFLKLDPFGPLNRRIAAVNQAEIHVDTLTPFLAIFKALGCDTLGDIDRIRKNCSEAAYQLACYQIGVTDLDIISSSLGPQNLCIAHILKQGGGSMGIRILLDTLNGASESNAAMAEVLLEQAHNLPFMNQ